MIIKMTWTDFLTSIDNQIKLFTRSDSDYSKLLDQLETAINSKFKGIQPMKVKDMQEVVNSLLSDTGSWKDLNIYLSSYSLNGLRVLSIYNKTVQYLSWALKVITDNGVAGKIANSRKLGENGTNTGKSKDTYSELPQVDTNTVSQFELDISYVSNISNNDNNSTYNRDVNEESNVTSTTWKEEVDNLQMIYMNEICNYIMNIPYTIYRAYSLDSMPVNELVKAYYKSVKEVFNINE